MPKLEVIKAGLLTTVQDMGRSGLAYYAVPSSGPMDPVAAKIALLLLRLPEDSPVLEITSIAPTLYFHDAAAIALSGADFGWTLNDAPVRVPSVVQVDACSTLKGRSSKNGLRGYLAIQGVWTLSPRLGSYTTYTPASLGGITGRALCAGDVLEWSILLDTNTDMHFTLYPGPEYDWLTSAGRLALAEQTFSISPDSNRMGLRLRGDRVEATAYQLAASAPVLPGFMQLPPSGQPIIVLQDGQTTGGYPRIGYIKEADLGRLNQLRLGEEVRFGVVS
ncbi:MAG: biotin-dependent carboxyltransferase family protein [Bacteroidota bacterium]